MWRALVIGHRYLGVVIGLLMLTWFASGIVMMYVGFPRLLESERIQTLSPIAWDACCRIADRPPDDDQVVRAQVETLIDAPVLRLRRSGKPDLLIDLAQGGKVRIEAEEAQAIALAAAPRIIGATAAVVATELIVSDRWTVGRYPRDRPLYRLDLDDPGRTIVYV